MSFGLENNKTIHFNPKIAGIFLGPKTKLLVMKSWSSDGFFLNFCLFQCTPLYLQWLSEQMEYPKNWKISCSCFDTNDSKMIDISLKVLNVSFNLKYQIRMSHQIWKIWFFGRFQPLDLPLF